VDLRLAVRLLLKSRGFALTAILALALGIGANTAIFSAVDAVLIRPLPFADPDRIVTVWEDSSYAGFPRNTPAPANYVDWKKQNQVFSEMTAFRGAAANLTGDGPPEFIVGRGVLPGFFRVLGVNAFLGRTLADGDEQPGENVVVLSYGLWQRRYGGDRALIGRHIIMDGEKRMVVGIMPPSFRFPTRREDFWIPARMTPEILARRGSHFLQVIARLKPGVGFERAQNDMTTIARRLQHDYPETNTNVGATVVPLREITSGDARTSLLVLLGGAGCVLLIACANVSNLLLARAAGRQKEMAVRAALGAGRARLIRQLITESLLLSISGGVAGLAVARAALRILAALVPDRLGITLTLDTRVLLFSGMVALATGVLFGLAPAVVASRLDLNEALKQGLRAGTGRSTGRLRDILVVAEVALALMLLVSAGLMVQTLSRLRSLDLGFKPENTLTMRTVLPRTKYKEGVRRNQFYEAVLDRVLALPGVESAAYSSNLPLTARGNTSGILIEGRPAPPPGTESDALYRVGTNSYLKTLGVKLLEGRLFTPDDRADTTPVVILNETCARQYWKGASPLGSRIKTDDGKIWRNVVGVVTDPRERGVDANLKCGVYLPVVQNPEAWAIPTDLIVRTKISPMSVAAAVREAIWSVDRDQPISAIRTMEEIVDLELANRNQQMLLLGSFALLALVLSALGIYGVLSYAVTQRTREIGLRMALGARAGDVLRMVGFHGAKLALAGLLIGTAAAMLAGRAMKQVLYEVSPLDAPTYASVALILAVVALAASTIPAFRASRLDPMTALRDE
jgi:putative ABC transport system permease protein